MACKMCYSAQIVADYKLFYREFGAILSIKEFSKLYHERQIDAKIKVPRVVDASFSSPESQEEDTLRRLIDGFNAQQQVSIEQEILKQRARLETAQRKLEVKTTKGATEDVRIATAKIDAGLEKLADLRRTELRPRDGRFFPGSYAPVMVVENGQRVVMPMRYLCRPAGVPAANDIKYPGCYNARRSSLKGYWRKLFGVRHGVIVVNAFYEHVMRDGGDVVLEFKPRGMQTMLIACLWSRWTAPGQPDLVSFAAITDEPPEEVVMAGHDRCPINLKAEHLDAWLNPDPAKVDAQYAILDDRERPYYEHRLAA